MFACFAFSVSFVAVAFLNFLFWSHKIKTTVQQCQNLNPEPAVSYSSGPLCVIESHLMRSARVQHIIFSVQTVTDSEIEHPTKILQIIPVR